MLNSRFKWFLLTIACLAMTPIAFISADAQRGYDGTGGEIIVPLLPAIIYLAVITFRDSKNILSKKD